MSKFEMILVEDISNLIGVKEATIKLWARHKKIPAYKFGSLWKFDRSEVLAWIETRKIQNL